MRRSALLFGVAAASLAGSAWADDLNNDGTTLTKPVTTSNASNGSAGDITFTAPGYIVVTTKNGAAVTIDSNNSVTDGGLIQNNADNATGVHILGGFTGGLTVLPDSIATTFENTGAINVNGISARGVVLDGAGAFTGDIDLQVTSTLTVTGANPIAVQIASPLNGNLTEGAITTVTGLNAIGVLVTAPISGMFSTAGTISAAGVVTYTATAVDAFSGSAVAVGASVGGGYVNAGPVSLTDTTGTASLSNAGTAPTLVIAPSVAGAAASDITIGLATSDVTNPSFSFINRGSIRASENDPGVNTISVQIGETGTAANTVTLPGGIYNRGTISAASESDNTFATSVHPADTNATALEIGNGAAIAPGTNVAALVNDGTIGATMGGNKSGVVTGILIQPGASLPSLESTGAISAAAGTSDTTVSNLTAYAIHDLSGTLTSIVNSGAIAAAATTLDNNSQIVVAIDISHTAANETLTTSGAITGDVQFGSAGTSGGVAGNQLTIDGVNASVAGAVTAAGTGTIDIHISSDGTGGTLATDNARAQSLDVGSSGVVAVALTKLSTPAAQVVVTGAASFAQGSRVDIVPTTFLPDSGTYTLVTAGGGLQFADYANTVNAAIPFLYNGSLSVSGNDLSVSLQRKTAAQLGLTGNEAAIYNPLTAAALTDNAYGAALLTLTNAADVKAAVDAAIPDVGGAIRALAVAMTDESTGVIGARQRSLVTSPSNVNDELRFWGQEFYNSVSGSSTSSQTGYTGAGQGAAFGAEWGALGTGRYGVGYTFAGSQETEDQPRSTKTDGDWHVVSFYAGWRFGDFFVTPQINVGEGDFTDRRAIAVASVDRSTTAKWEGYLATGGASTGYIFNVAGFQIMPQIALDATFLRQGAYKEASSGGLGLSMDAQNQESLRTFAGVAALGNYQWDDGNFQPQFLAGWSHEFIDSPGTIDASFESVPGSAFQLSGPSIATDRVVGGAGFAYIFGNWQAGVNADATAAQGAIAESATVSLSSRF